MPFPAEVFRPGRQDPPVVTSLNPPQSDDQTERNTTIFITESKAENRCFGLL